jgi:8-oxo-dGTP pyrophosphatase MutT (NUDIX family)
MQDRVTTRVEQVTLPSGETYDHSISTVAGGLGAVIIPVVVHRDMAHLGLIEIYRPAIKSTGLEFPRGATSDLFANEAARELLEETGLTPNRLTRLANIHTDTGSLDNTVGIWLAVVAPDLDDKRTWMRQSEGFVDAETGSSFRWLQDGEVVGAIRNGRIACALTLAAWACYRDSAERR